MKAECQCGRLSVDLPGPSSFVAVCHCIDCQRRTGSPFGVLAYYAAADLIITGEARRFERAGADGNVVESFFCPECGSTVYVTLGRQPSLIGVAVGAIANPGFQSPHVSVWEQSMHGWVTVPGGVRHFTQGIP